jgi:hypothetical protein
MLGDNLNPKIHIEAGRINCRPLAFKCTALYTCQHFGVKQCLVYSFILYIVILTIQVIFTSGSKYP